MDVPTTPSPSFVVEGPRRPSAPGRDERAEAVSIESSSATSKVSGGDGERSSPPKPRTEDVERVVEVLNARVQVVHRHLKFSVHEATSRTVITLTDSQSGEVIRQIPSDDVLRLVERLAGRAAEGGSGGTNPDRGAGRVYRQADDDVGSGTGTILETEF